MEKENLDKKLQVLLSSNDEHALYQILLRKALEDGRRPPPMSAYVRDLIREHIVKETGEQKSFVKDKVNEIMKKSKPKSKPDNNG